MKIINWLVNTIALVLVFLLSILLVSLNGAEVELNLWGFAVPVTLGSALVLFFITGTFLGFCINLFSRK